MHELSIVMNIVEIANEEVQKHQAQKVEMIDLEIGELSGIDFDAFEFAWSAVVHDTILQNAERKMHRIEGKSICGTCGHHFRLFQVYEPCPLCGEVLNDIISGQELKVKQMILS